MVAGEVLLEGEAGLLSLFYNSTNKCWKVDPKMRWLDCIDRHDCIDHHDCIFVFTEDLKKYDLLTHLLTVNLKSRNGNTSKNNIFLQISSIESWWGSHRGGLSAQGANNHFTSLILLDPRSSILETGFSILLLLHTLTLTPVCRTSSYKLYRTLTWSGCRSAVCS